MWEPPQLNECEESTDYKKTVSVSNTLYVHTCAATYRVTLTTVAWWLEAVLCEGTPAHGEDVSGVVLAPVIKRTPPPVKHDEDLVALHFSNGGRADEVWVLLVHSLQLQAWLKAVLRRSRRLLKTSPICSLQQLLNVHIANMKVSYSLYKMFNLSDAKYLFKGCCWCHLCSI